MRKFFLFAALIFLLGVGVFIYIKFFFVFGTGVKTGHLNYLVHKGYVFKTYEGKLIQSGFTTEVKGALTSNVFEFSVADKAVADSLMKAGGKEVQLHYKEYLGAIPWRGYSKFVVDKIIAVRNTEPDGSLPPVAE